MNRSASVTHQHSRTGWLPVAAIGVLVTVLMSGQLNSAVADDVNTLTPGTYTMPPNVGAPPGPDQPIPFSHAQHAGDLRLPCITCHTSALSTATNDEAAEADIGLPPTTTCMNISAWVAAADTPPFPPSKRNICL